MLNMKEKLKSYDEATKKLVNQANGYNLPNIGKKSFSEIVYALRESFKQQETHKQIFGAYVVGKNDSFSEGFCMYGTYYLYKILPDIFKIMRDPDHWWLVDLNNKQFDLTYCQFPFEYDYKYGEQEKRIGVDKDFTEEINKMAVVLGKCAGLD